MRHFHIRASFTYKGNFCLDTTHLHYPPIDLRGGRRGEFPPFEYEAISFLLDASSVFGSFAGRPSIEREGPQLPTHTPGLLIFAYFYFLRRFRL